MYLRTLNSIKLIMVSFIPFIIFFQEEKLSYFPSPGSCLGGKYIHSFSNMFVYKNLPFPQIRCPFSQIVKSMAANVVKQSFA